MGNYLSNLTLAQIKSKITHTYVFYPANSEGSNYHQLGISALEL